MRVLLADLSTLAVEDELAALLLSEVTSVLMASSCVCVERFFPPISHTSVSAGDYVYVWHENLLRLFEAAISRGSRAR